MRMEDKSRRLVKDGARWEDRDREVDGEWRLGLDDGN